MHNILTSLKIVIKEHKLLINADNHIIVSSVLNSVNDILKNLVTNKIEGVKSRWFGKVRDFFMNNFLLILNTREKAQSLPPQISEVNRREKLFNASKYRNEPVRRKYV